MKMPLIIPTKPPVMNYPIHTTEVDTNTYHYTPQLTLVDKVVLAGVIIAMVLVLYLLWKEIKELL